MRFTLFLLSAEVLLHMLKGDILARMALAHVSLPVSLTLPLKSRCFCYCFPLVLHTECCTYVLLHWFYSVCVCEVLLHMCKGDILACMALAHVSLPNIVWTSRQQIKNTYEIQLNMFENQRA